MGLDAVTVMKLKSEFQPGKIIASAVVFVSLSRSNQCVYLLPHIKSSHMVNRSKEKSRVFDAIFNKSDGTAEFGFSDTKNVHTVFQARNIK